MIPPPIIAERIACLSPQESCDRLPAPPLAAPTGSDRLLLGLESFARHMTDEGYQLQQGLAEAGYELWGRNFPHAAQDVRKILAQRSPHTIIVQDKREWDRHNDTCFDPQAAFWHCRDLAKRPDVFKVTILKDAQQRPLYHRQAADEIGCHAWIVYYHPHIVAHLAPFVRPQHLVRTYHSVNPADVPAYSADRQYGCLVSGAKCRTVYPFRWRMFRAAGRLPDTIVMRHPGYLPRGHATPAYLQFLSQCKVAICTCSIYGYALRKLIEATACGCVVITDLPPDEVLPEIDGNLIRVHPETSVEEMREIVGSAIAAYNPERQAEFARRAVAFYDYRRQCRQLAANIVALRERWNAESEKSGVG